MNSPKPLPDTPPPVWPFPTYKGKPYTPAPVKRDPARKPKWEKEAPV